MKKELVEISMENQVGLIALFVKDLSEGARTTYAEAVDAGDDILMACGKAVLHDQVVAALVAVVGDETEEHF